MRAQVSPPAPVPSWWVGPLSWDAFHDEVEKRFPAMSRSRESWCVDPCRGLNELKHLMSPVRRTRVES